MDDDQAVGARVAAARRMADLDQRQLADRINTPKLGFKNIGKIERGERRLAPHEAPLFAAALGVPVEFFYEPPAPEVDQASVNGNGSELPQLDRIERKLDMILGVLGAIPAPAEGAAMTDSLLDLLPEGLRPGDEVQRRAG